MKRLLIICLFATASIFGQGYGGAGTSGNPWLIPNAEALDSIRYNIDGTPYFYLQTADIDLSTFNGGFWTPIGHNAVSEQFDGGYNGGRYKIQNLVITDSEMTEYNNDWHAGLFGEWQHSTGAGDNTEVMQHIHLENVTITLTNAIGSGAGDDIFVGSLIGHIYEVSSGTAKVDSCTVTNVNIQTAGNLYHRVGGLVGYAQNSTSFFQCAVIGPDTVTATGTTSQHTVGGFIGNAHTASVNQCYVTEVYGYTNRNAAYLAGFMNYGNANDCFAYDVVLVDNATNVTGFMQSGPFHGTHNTTTNRTYVVGTITFNAIADTNGYCGLSSGAGNDNFWDITVNPAIDGITNNTGSLTVEGMPTDSMKTEGTFTWKNWDFASDTLWDIRSGTMGGYPYLLWAAAFTQPILNHPDSAGIYFREHDTTLVHWTASDDTLMTEQYLHYSTNGGTDWILIDTVAIGDTSYNWIIPDAPTSTGKIKISSDVFVRSDSSTNNFTILTSSKLEIIYPIDKAGVSIFPGDTLHINTKSLFVNDIWYWWSNDSTNWYWIDSTEVDTVNNQYYDTTNYVWTFDGIVAGPEVWIQAKEQGDTTLYSFSRSYINVGPNIPLGNMVCQGDSGGTFVEKFIIYDPACGWNSVPWRYYTGRLDDEGQSRTWTYNGCPLPRTTPPCQFSLAAPVYLTTAIDTTTTYMNAFYSNLGASVVYQGRLYYVSAETLYVNDLVNGIDSIFVADLSAMYVGAPAWAVGDEILQVYNVQRSKISGEYIPADTTFENLNDVDFTPKILIGQSLSIFDVISVEALPYPNNADPAVDTQKILTGASFGRFYFRGIHPKIEKR